MMWFLGYLTLSCVIALLALIANRDEAWPEKESIWWFFLWPIFVLLLVIVILLSILLYTSDLNQ